MPSYAYSMMNDEGCLIEVVAAEASNDDMAIAMMDTLPAHDVAQIKLRQGQRIIAKKFLTPGHTTK